MCNKFFIINSIFFLVTWCHTQAALYVHTVLTGMCLTHAVCLHVEYRPYVNLSYITIRLSDTYVFLCQYRRVNTTVDILALIYKVRRGHFLILHPTQKHIRVQSFKLKMSKDLTLSWYNILFI